MVRESLLYEARAQRERPTPAWAAPSAHPRHRGSAPAHRPLRAARPRANRRRPPPAPACGIPRRKKIEGSGESPRASASPPCVVTSTDSPHRRRRRSGTPDGPLQDRCQLACVRARRAPVIRGARALQAANDANDLGREQPWILDVDDREDGQHHVQPSHPESRERRAPHAP